MEKTKHCQVIKTFNITDDQCALLFLENINKKVTLNERICIRLELLRIKKLVHNNDSYIKENR